MEISIEKLIKIVVKEVTAELLKRGINVSPHSLEKAATQSPVTRKELCEIINLKSYKSPVLTENHLASLESNVREIILPQGTVITPGARDIIAKRRLTINKNHKSN